MTSTLTQARRTKAEAVAVAARCNVDESTHPVDERWTFAAVQGHDSYSDTLLDFWTVEVHDENGQHIGPVIRG